MHKILLTIGLTVLMALPAMAERRVKPKPGPNGELPDRPRKNLDGKDGQERGKRPHCAKGKHKHPHFIPFDLMDVDESGAVSKDEFLEAHAKRLDKMIEKMKEAGKEIPEERLEGAEERANKIFDHIDADESGDLTKEEMQEARKKFLKRHGKDGKRGKKDCDKKDGPKDEVNPAA